MFFESKAGWAVWHSQTKLKEYNNLTRFQYKILYPIKKYKILLDRWVDGLKELVLIFNKT